MSCPIISSDAVPSIYWVAAYDSGPKNGVQCSLHFSAASRGGSVWVLYPDDTEYVPPNNNPPTYEYEQWQGALDNEIITGPAPMMSAECTIGPGSEFEGIDYDVGLQIYTN